MKKLISLLLAVMMVFGCMMVGSADNSAEGLTVNGWNGWSVTSGSAVTTAVNPADGERGDVVKINGTATLTPDATNAKIPVVELSVDVYGTGIVALVDGNGNVAAQVDLSTVGSYNASAWNEVKLFAVTGSKTYKAYVNDVEVVGNGTVGQLTVPEKISFTGTNMYVDNINLKEVSKKSSYLDFGTANVYTPDFSTIARPGEMDGTNGWWVETLNTNTTLNYSVDTQKFAADSTKKNVIKIEKTSDASAAYANRLWRPSSYPGSSVISMDIYVEKDNGGELVLFLNDKDYGTNLNNNRVGVLSLYGGSLLLFDNGNIVEVKDAYVEKAWHNLRVEISQETQSADFYWDNNKVNSKPYVLRSNSGETFTKFANVGFELNSSLKSCEFYVANFKIDQPLAGEVNRVVFEENFDGSEHKFTSVDLDGMEDVTTLTSGYDQTVIADGQTMRNGVGRYNRSVYKDSYAYHVTEGTSVQDDNAGYDLHGAEMVSTPELNLKGAKEIIVTFDIYSPAIAKTSGNDFADTLMVGLSAEQKLPDVCETYMMIQSNNHGVYFNSNGNFNSYVNNYKEKWGTVTYKMNTEMYHPSGETAGISLNGGSSAWSTAPITTEDLSKFKYLTMTIHENRGGRFYLDNFKIQARQDVGEVLDNYYAAADYYTNDITRNGVSNIEAVSVADDGTNVTVALNKNGTYTIPAGTKLFVAVFSGDNMTDCGITGISDSNFTEGVGSCTLSGVEIPEGSVVRVYIFDGSLIPQTKLPYSEQK